MIAVPISPTIPQHFRTPAPICTDQRRKVKPNAVADDSANVHRSSESVVLASSRQTAIAGARKAREISLALLMNPSRKSFILFFPIKTSTLSLQKGGE